MSWDAVGKALDVALVLPRASRSNPIDHGQLRLLFRTTILKSVGRAELGRRDQDCIASINKRLKYLLSHDLIEYEERYQGNALRGRFKTSEAGAALVATLSRERTLLEMISAFDRVYDRIGSHQLNVAHLKIMTFMASGNVVCVPDVIKHTSANRQTVRSRLKTMRDWGLLAVEEQVNAGGNKHYNHWRITSDGRDIVTQFFPEGFSKNRYGCRRTEGCSEGSARRERNAQNTQQCRAQSMAINR